MPKHLLLFAGCSAALAAAPLAGAAIIDLTQAGSSAMVGGATFATSDLHSTGTGVIEPFVRIQNNGFEQGYNTSASSVPFDEKPGQWTHDLRISDLVMREIGGVLTFEFILDINQVRSGNGRLLSLDAVQVYTSSTPSQNTTNVASLGTLHYDLDATEENHVLLDYMLNEGSGGGDMTLFLPIAWFSTATSDDYLYLYSAFGTHSAANAGFEEWALRRVEVPAPGPLSLFAAGVMLILRRSRTPD
jgi:hypothetical protein